LRLVNEIAIPADLNAAAALIWTWTAQFAPRMGAAVLVLVGGYLLARWAGRAFASLIEDALGVDSTLAPVVGIVVRYAILIVVFVATLGQLGIQTASVLAALGAAGLAVGLALQGTLSNIAAGIMLLWLRPFRVGDYVETPAVSGAVTEIGLFATEFETFDGVFRFVPNALIWNQPLVNYTRNATRLAILSVGIKLDDDPEKAMDLIRDVVAADTDTVAREPATEVFLDSLTDGFVFIGIRAWLPSRTYWTAHRVLAERIRSRLGDAGIVAQRLLHASPDVGDPRRRLAPPQRRSRLRFGFRNRTSQAPAE
jgi:small conductance mechanosensitive channel